MPAKLIEDTLHTWREAERLLTQLSPVEPAYEAVRQIVVGLQASYSRLSMQDLTADILAECRLTLDQARSTLLGLRPA